MKILVTGGAGFIGANFARFWHESYPEDTLVVLDALTYAGNLTSISDLEIPFVHANIGDTDKVAKALEDFEITHVVNFAAESHNSLAILDPVRFFSTNVGGTVGLLEAARRFGGLERFHHVSTCEVYGDLDLETERAFDEEDPYRPRTPYNASKAGADHAVRAYSLTYGIPVTITNCANNYGPYQFPEKLIPLFVSRALENEPLPLYESKQNRREWIHVLDHCRAIDAVVRRGRTGETYHVGTGIERSVEQIAHAILNHLGLSEELLTTVPDRPSHDRRYVLNSTKIRTQLGWEPIVEFREGLSETIEWYRNNRSWWEPLIGRSPVSETTAWKRP